MNILNIVLCYLLITINAYADGSHASHSLEASGADKVGSASISTLNLEIEVTDGYGRGFFFETATNKEEELINQGYASLNVFHYVDAYRSFKTAYHLNHKSIFALVGMSFAVLTQDTGANGAKLAALALNDAHKVALASNPSEKEAAWLKFSKFFYLMKIGNSNLLDDQEAIDGGETFQNLAKVDGENLEFKTFIHWVLLNNSNSQYIKSVLESVLVSEPNHAGAHHYLLHLFEMTHDIAAARKHAEVLITLALGSAHAQHMYGHTLPQTGEWDEALKQFLIADKIHHDRAASKIGRAHV